MTAARAARELPLRPPRFPPTRRQQATDMARLHPGTMGTTGTTAAPRRAARREATLVSLFAACLLAHGCATNHASFPREHAASAVSVADIHIESTTSYWSAVFADEAMSGTGVDAPEARSGRGELFVISGVLRNTSRVPLRAVYLSFELLDADGRIVHRQDGFNYGAESLVGAPPEAQPEVVPIPAGGEDRYRMILFGAELPAFERVAVRVTAAEPLASKPSAATPR